MNDDEKIRDDVLAELEFQPQVDATAIGVAVKNGVVTLSGHVSNYAEKIAAESAAKRVKGVKGLAQEITVRLPSGVRHDDTEIAQRAADILKWSVTAPETGVKVKCENGWVTLSGEAMWAYQRYEAERAVRGLAGVIGVTNQIALIGGVKAADVKDRIKRALHRNAELDASTINVAVEGSKVTLAGKVSAWPERNIAESAAWAVPGVYQVVDHLSVS
jgi:osmotically-inducible protein OsmY